MLLAIWPLFIAMPEPSNYALLDQRKRDERRLAKHKKQVEEELEKRKQRGPKLQTERGLVADTSLPISDQSVGVVTNGVLGYVALERGLSEPLGTSITKSDDVSLGVDSTVIQYHGKQQENNDMAIIMIILSNI